MQTRRRFLIFFDLRAPTASAVKKKSSSLQSQLQAISLRHSSRYSASRSISIRRRGSGCRERNRDVVKGEKRSERKEHSLSRQPQASQRSLGLFAALHSTTLSRSLKSRQRGGTLNPSLTLEGSSNKKKNARKRKNAPPLQKVQALQKKSGASQREEKTPIHFSLFRPPSPPPSGRSLSPSLLFFLWLGAEKRKNKKSLRFLTLSLFLTMHVVAASEPTTTGLELGGAKAAVVPEKKRAAARIGSRAAADLDSADDDEEPLCSTSHPADPTLETCCHEPPPIALNPLNSWLFFGEKALRLPIPPTNDIVVSRSFFWFFFVSRSPRKKKTCRAAVVSRILSTILSY